MCAATDMGPVSVAFAVVVSETPSGTRDRDRNRGRCESKTSAPRRWDSFTFTVAVMSLEYESVMPTSVPMLGSHPCIRKLLVKDTACVGIAYVCGTTTMMLAWASGAENRTAETAAAEMNPNFVAILPSNPTERPRRTGTQGQC